MNLPKDGPTPLIRTDFSDDKAWRRIVEASTQSSPKGFRANIAVLDDPAFQNADIDQLAALAGNTTEHPLLIVADGLTMTNPELPLLCIETFPPRESFRVAPDNLWSVENNLSLANMDMSEFTSAMDPDGIFRGFNDE